jgi:hypothetical protein
MLLEKMQFALQGSVCGVLLAVRQHGKDRVTFLLCDFEVQCLGFFYSLGRLWTV